MAEVVSLGVDLGGTKIEAAVLRRIGEGTEERAEVLLRRRVPTGAEGGYEAVLDATLALIRSVAADVGRRPERLPTGLGMPGSVTRREGLVKNSNTVCLNGKPFRQDLGKALGRRIEFENDANCFALAEARLGAGRAYRDGIVFGVILGTGVGGGIVVNGRVWPGLQGLGGEWGHHAVGPWRSENHAAEATDGREVGLGLSERGRCYCGKTGCLELYASGPAVERDYYRRTGRRARLPEIAARRASDPDAAAAIEELLEALGRGLANLIDILDPSAIVLGGGVSNLDFLYTEGVERVRRFVFNDELLTPIVRHELGDSAGVLGAALLAG
nr:MAG: sugar kinase [Pseudomonadota bacterium]